MTTILNDLININDDRIEDYQLVIKTIPELDVDLKAIIEGMIAESRQYKTSFLNKLNQISNDTTKQEARDVYNKWLTLRKSFTNVTRTAILENCVSSEEAIIQAYEMALNLHDNEGDTTQLIERQLKTLKENLELLKRYNASHQQFD